jgi:putative membrane protein
MVAFWGLLAAGVVWLLRTIRPADREATATTAPTARQILDERLARGELTEEEYLRRRDLLRAR